MLSVFKKHLKVLGLILSNENGYAWLIPAAMAAMGALKAKKQQKAAADHDKYRRAVLQHSYWTKMKDPGAKDAGPGVLGGGIQGGLMGMGANQQLGIGNSFMGAAPATAAASPSSGDSSSPSIVPKEPTRNVAAMQESPLQGRIDMMQQPTTINGQPFMLRQNNPTAAQGAYDQFAKGQWLGGRQGGY